MARNSTPPQVIYVTQAPKKKTSCAASGCLGLIVIMVVIGISGSLSKKAADRARLKEERQEQESFLAGKPKLLEELRSLIEAGNPDRAIARIRSAGPAGTADPDITKLQQQAQLNSARARLTQTSIVAKRLDLLATIVDLDPTDTESANELKALRLQNARDILSSEKEANLRRTALETLERGDALTSKERNELTKIRADEAKAAQLQAEAKAKQDELENRKKRISKAFSAWDGSVPKLVRLVKESMHDPSSFDHASTRYEDRRDHLEVEMTYRGKNAFGAIILNRIRVKTTLDGDVLEIVKSGMPD